MLGTIPYSPLQILTDIKYQDKMSALLFWGKQSWDLSVNMLSGRDFFNADYVKIVSIYFKFTYLAESGYS